MHLAPRQQVRVLERHAGDLHRPVHLVAEDGDAAAVRPHQPGDELHQRWTCRSRTGRPRRRTRRCSTCSVVPCSASTSPDAPLIGQRDVVDIDGRIHERHATAALRASRGRRCVSELPLGGRRQILAGEDVGRLRLVLELVGDGDLVDRLRRAAPCRRRRSRSALHPRRDEVVACSDIFRRASSIFSSPVSLRFITDLIAAVRVLDRCR